MGEQQKFEKTVSAVISACALAVALGLFVHHMGA